MQKARTGSVAHMLGDLIGIMGDAHGDQPLHLQVYGKIKDAIMSGALPSDTKLPSSRGLANQLGVSRNTVISAYEQLIAEGFLSTRHGSGTYVTELALPLKPGRARERPAPSIADRVRKLEPTSGSDRFAGLSLFPGFPDPELFPYKLWNRIQMQAARNLQDALPKISLTNGFMPLLEALARHLAVTRGISVEPDQIFITAGAAQSVNLITRAVANRDCVAWVEEPGYQVVIQSLKLADMRMTHVHVDEDGMNVEEADKRYDPPKIIYVTTSYQYPLGHTMPINRRLKLLELAERHKAWIIEDDYDGEFRYRGKPIPALFGLEDNGSTIYMGTFSKAFSPALRTSFIVAPQSLVKQLQSIYPTYGNVSSIAVQSALAEFIRNGFFAKHIEQVRQAYGSRRAAMEGALREHCGIETKEVGSLPGGLHIPVGISGIEDEMGVLADAAAYDIGCLPLSRDYSTSDARAAGLLLGFTSRPEDKIERAIQALATIVQRHRGTFVLPKDVVP